jgi:hypothetical protein
MIRWALFPDDALGRRCPLLGAFPRRGDDFRSILVLFSGRAMMDGNVAAAKAASSSNRWITTTVMMMLLFDAMRCDATLGIALCRS